MKGSGRGLTYGSTGIRLKRLVTTTRNLSQDSRSSERGLKPGPAPSAVT